MHLVHMLPKDLNVHVYSIKDKAIVEKFTDSSLVPAQE